MSILADAQCSVFHFKEASFEPCIVFLALKMVPDGIGQCCFVVERTKQITT